jgi:cyclin-dependent kinase 8/11
MVLWQLNREIRHENIVALREVILEDKSIYMVFEYADHDFLVHVQNTPWFAIVLSWHLPQQLIHQHSTPTRRPIPHPILKSLIHQLLNGVVYLHAFHILHRDLKPANILITAARRRLQANQGIPS